MSRIEYGSSDLRASSGEESARAYVAKFKAECRRIRSQLPVETRHRISFSKTGDDLVGKVDGRPVYSSRAEAAIRRAQKARLQATRLKSAR